MLQILKKNRMSRKILDEKKSSKILEQQNIFTNVLRKKTDLLIQILYTHNAMRNTRRIKKSLPRRAPGLPMFSTRAMQVYNYNLTQFFFSSQLHNKL